METDSDEKQLLNQVLNAVKVTPSLNEDLQVEVMKVGLTGLPVCIIGTGTKSGPPTPPAPIVVWKMPLLSGHASSSSVIVGPQSNSAY